MIPTNPTTPVSWTAAAAPAVAPVPAVMAVAPAAAAARDAQAGLEQRRGQPRAAGRTDASDQAADDRTTRRERAEAVQARTERAEEQAQRDRELEEARRESVEHLRQSLRKAWDASAAVVERALAQEKEKEATAPTGAQTARALDAYGAPVTPDRTPGLSRRV